MIKNLSGRELLMKRLNKGGSSFRFARSPVAPRITKIQGSAVFETRHNPYASVEEKDSDIPSVD
jgi:hypothetical protein